jgi:hypothetical protein
MALQSLQRALRATVYGQIPLLAVPVTTSALLSDDVALEPVPSEPRDRPRSLSPGICTHVFRCRRGVMYPFFGWSELSIFEYLKTEMEGLRCLVVTRLGLFCFASICSLFSKAKNGTVEVAPGIFEGRWARC